MEYFFNFEKLGYIKGERPAGCILCLIRDHSEKVTNLTVFENSSFNVSLNLYPYNPGHLMLFPKRHVEDVRELTDEEATIEHKLIRASLDVLDETHTPAGYNLGYNMGLDAGASIAHLHFHIIPRYPHETGIADLIAGKRVLVEDPRDTARRIRAAFDRYCSDHPRSSLIT